MEATHYLYLALPPRRSLAHDATPEEFQVLRRHVAYLRTLADAGKLLLAGPTLDGAYGVAILKVVEAAEAESIVSADPAVLEGLFKVRLHPISLGILAP